MWQEISIREIQGVQIGQAENAAAGTGVTVFLCGRGAPTGLDVRGGGPASRESQLLSPLASAQAVHAVVLSGGQRVRPGRRGRRDALSGGARAGL